MKKERRLYSRLDTDICGTLYKDGVEIPIRIKDISERGIGIEIKEKDIPTDWKVNKKECFTVSFYDDSTPGLDIVKNKLNQCDFDTVYIKKSNNTIYIGGKLVEDEYNYVDYVASKKANRFIARVKYMDFARA